ncbi:hypothetical protein OAE23_01115 [Synechococcus sp. AH-551-E11]|nr:hypothetical protein [Synechococcus sp. AH-551-E11]MDB4616683.1 hypothetical protein [Synechococcus sp. AH-551-E11]
MQSSIKRVAFLSFGTQIFTRAINLGLSVSFIRFASADSVGYFTLLITAAQMVCTLGRMGTNYSYSVILPQRTDPKSKSRLTATYVIFSSIISVLIAIIVLWQVMQNPASAAIPNKYNWLFLFLGIIYLYGDSLSEIIWSLHLAEGRFRAVFLRDVWLALGKGLIPLFGALFFGILGVIGGLSITCIINSVAAINLLKNETKISQYLCIRKLFSWKDLLQLLKKGIPFFSVPLVSNLILWPLLMKVISNQGIERLDGLRVAQICAQLVGVISASLIPILLVKSGQNERIGDIMHQRSFQACWIISILIYCIYALSDTTLLPLIFGQGPANNAISIARIAIIAAAIQGLSQIPMQRPYPTSSLLKLSFLQVGSLLIAAIVSITIILPINGLVSYTSIGLISPLITVIFLPGFIRHRLTPNSTPVIAQICISIFLISTCFTPFNTSIEIGGLIISMTAATLLNFRFLLELRPQAQQNS